MENIFLNIFLVIGILLIYSGLSGILTDIVRKRKIFKRKYIILALGIIVTILAIIPRIFDNKIMHFIRYVSIYFAVTFIIFCISSIVVNLRIKRKEEIRKVDDLGRITIPVTKRKELEISTGDKLEVYKSGKNIILKKVDVKISKDTIQIVRAIINGELEIDIEVKHLKTRFDKNYNKNHELKVIDELGRILIPRELREELNINRNDKMKICIKDNMIILIRTE